MSEYEVMISWNVGERIFVNLGRDSFNELSTPLNVRDLKLVFNFKNDISQALFLRPGKKERMKFVIDFTVTGYLSIHLLGSTILEMTKFTRVYKSRTELADIHLPLDACDVTSKCLPCIASRYTENGQLRKNLSLDLESVVISGYLIFSETTKQVTNSQTVKKNEEHLLKLSVDVGSLNQNQDQTPFSDVNFKCGDTIIPAHRNILAARSSVFAAMFKNKLLESQTGFVDITDIEPSVVRIMLTYIYSGKCDDLTESTVGQLLFAADKYQLEELKEICTCFLNSKFSLDNVLQCLILGDMHDSKLKAYALEFIGKGGHFLQLEGTQEWKGLRKEKPDLAMDVMTSIIMHSRK